MGRSLEEFVEDFAIFDDWDDRYSYIIDLGKKLPPMPDSDKTDETKVRGCTSQVWMTCTEDKTASPVTLNFHADSDAFIVKGLISILVEIYSDRTPSEVLAIDASDVLKQLGFDNGLVRNRRDGFVSMVDRMKAEAQSRL